MTTFERNLQTYIQVLFYGGMFCVAFACSTPKHWMRKVRSGPTPTHSHAHCKVLCTGQVDYKRLKDESKACKRNVTEYLIDAGVRSEAAGCRGHFELHSILYMHCMERRIVVHCKRTSGVRIRDSWHWWPIINGYLKFGSTSKFSKRSSLRRQCVQHGRHE